MSKRPPNSKAETSTAAASGESSLIIRRVMLSQLLFSLGNSLTVGGFFSYFFAEFEPSALLVSVSLILPESSQALSVLARPVLSRCIGRKKLWITGLLAGRMAALLIPAALLVPATERHTALLSILVCTAVWYLLQGLAYVSLISWLSDLVPDVRWGQLFRSREIAGLLVWMAVPLGVAVLRQKVVDGLPPAAKTLSYAVIFLCGGLLAMSSILPLLKLPDVPWQPVQRSEVAGHVVPHRFSAAFRWLTLSRWWAAVFQGLTQATFFLFATRVLHLNLMTYLLLASCGRLLQLPTAWWGGRLCDAGHDKTGLAVGLLLASCALPCWLLASPAQWWWLFAAQACWAGFGLVNVCGPSLCLKVSPRSDNTTHWALYDQVAGLLAGLAGLLGGIWLDQMLTSPGEALAVFSQPISELLAQQAPQLWAGAVPDEVLAASRPYQVLFLISWLGRLIAPLWLLGVRNYGVNGVGRIQNDDVGKIIPENSL